MGLKKLLEAGWTLRQLEDQLDLQENVMSEPNRDLDHLIELYHNLFRMHSYVELLTQNREPGIRARADLLLKSSYERAKEAIDGRRHWSFLEKP